MHIPIFYSSHYQKIFIFYGPKIWNLVLPYIKDKAYNIPVTVQQYKNKFKKFLLTMQSDASEDEWLSTNFSIESYLAKTKHDPYYLETMHNTALASLTMVFEDQNN